ncbi:putative short-chain dehydrogenase [Thozetella sp. PMI_491]|nr:putative short-chain dehydrogenase [Thozetella sp. PMI_491]
MPGILSFALSQLKDLALASPPADIGKRTYVITGANTGLGYECAKHLIKYGAGRVILAVRSSSKGEAALAELRKETDQPNAGEVWQVDQESFASVEAFASRLQTLDRLDGLIANAGVARLDYGVAEGLEVSLVVNVLSTFLLALRALPKLRETATKAGTKSNLTIVASETGLMPMVKDRLDGLSSSTNIFEALSDPATMADRYPLTKQLDILSTRALAQLFPVSENGVTINVVNPGFCRSELSRDSKGLMRLQIKVMKSVLARTTEQGSRTLLHAALAGPETHGKYLSACAISDDDIPSWLAGEVGAKKERRVWEDLLKELEVKGHAVDLASLGARL